MGGGKAQGRGGEAGFEEGSPSGLGRVREVTGSAEHMVRRVHLVCTAALTGNLSSEKGQGYCFAAEAVQTLPRDRHS